MTFVDELSSLGFLGRRLGVDSEKAFPCFANISRARSRAAIISRCIGMSCSWEPLRGVRLFLFASPSDVLGVEGGDERQQSTLGFGVLRILFV